MYRIYVACAHKYETSAKFEKQYAIQKVCCLELGVTVVC